VKKLNSSSDLEELRATIQKDRDSNKTHVTVCGGTGCHALGCREVYDTFNNELKNQNLQDKVDLIETGCHGFCERGPIVIIKPAGIFYERVRVDHIPHIITRTIVNDEIIDDLLYQDPETGKNIVYEKEVPFYSKQERLILGNNDKLRPGEIEDYIALDGYSALNKALFNMKPEEIVNEIKQSGLRGRGGGGFPTGRKWESCKAAKGDPKYVICNADEGDPGAYMDRSLLEGNPHSVIEGMIIGAFAIGSNNGYVYVRNEYPLAVKNVQLAIKQAEECGLLGDNILGSDFNFNIKVNRGGGAFVCGESTALMASLEGQRGEPRPKYVHTVESGLWNKPSNLNNVETWANVPVIINNGSNWYNSKGTEGSKGTKIFSLVGNINNTGLVEVPMGTTFAQIIHKIGGGIPDGKKLKAVQTGGPSGGCIPKDLIGVPIDFDALTELGSMMGSGGMIVMDEDTCMVDIAKYFVNFLKEESCGKCTPCREGLYQMGEILKDISEGNGTEDQLENLEVLASVMNHGSLCALGQTAANPVLSTIRYFKDEYKMHIFEKKCPARICTQLLTYTIDEEKCTGCRRCAKVCPEEAITGEKKELHVIDQGKCIQCGSCFDSCKFEAVIKE
jgi:NADH-quinone oxidoreductase subunit F